MDNTINNNLEKYYGYFDTVDADVPVYDPGIDIPCLSCFKPLNLRQRVSICFTWFDNQQGDKSYFYRLHKDCHDSLTQDELGEFEGFMLDKERPECSSPS